jgi:hypothetical protein
LLQRIWEVLCRIALGSGAYPERFEPVAQTGQTAFGKDFHVLADVTTTVAWKQFVDVIYEQDRTLCVEWQALALPLDTAYALPYGTVYVDYVVGGARHSRQYPLTNRLSRITVTARQLRVNVGLLVANDQSGKGAPAFADLAVNVSASEGRAGMREDAALVHISQEIAAAPIQIGINGVIRAMSFYAPSSDVNLYLMLFRNTVSPVAGAQPSYIFGDGSNAVNETPVFFDVNNNFWYAVSTSPIVYAVPGTANCAFYAQYDSGATSD